jgi:hypothetical protein
MRLLSKQQVAAAKNSEKNREIQEGLKISRRVDALRELMANDEASLIKFRDESLSAVMQQIAEATTEKESIQGEVQQLRTEKSAGLSEVEKAKELLALKEKDIFLQEASIEEREKQCAVRDAEYQKSLVFLDSEKERIVRQAVASDDAYRSAFSYRDESAKILAAARKSEQDSMNAYRDMQAKVSEEWNAVRAKSEEAEKRESAADKKMLAVMAKELELRTMENALREKDAQIVGRIEEVNRGKDEYALLVKQAQDEAERARTHTDSAITARMFIEAEREKLTKLILDAETKAKESGEKQREMEQELSNREAQVAQREADVAQREAENEIIEKKLEQQAIKIADRTKVRDIMLKNVGKL